MVSELEVCTIANKLSGSGATYAEFLCQLFKDKYIEIYVGDSYEEVKTEQVSTSFPAVFCGKVITAYRECLVVRSVYIDNNKTIKMGNLMFFNERAIRSLTEVSELGGSIEEMIMKRKHSIHLKKKFG